MDDKELKEQLARGPLVKNGFDEQLRRRIHAEIDRPTRRKPRLWMMPWARVGAAFTMLVAVLAGVWMWQLQSGELGTALKIQDQAANGAIPISTSSEPAYTTEKPRSAMLIGLRKDIPEGDNGGPSSTYRTLLIASEDGQLKIESSGAGIWMPYKMQFWRIDAIKGSLGKGMQTIAAVPAGVPIPDTITADSMLRRTEKLLYAGNKYVSLLQSTVVTREGESVTNNDVWVKDVVQLSPQQRETEIVEGSEAHYKLSELVPAFQSKDEIEQWTISRIAGQWVGRVPVTRGFSIAGWQQINEPLSKDVVSYDKLSVSWDEINKRAPSAQDAFTSPAEDLLAVVEKDAIHISAYRMKDEDMKPLTIKLDNQESIVMVQWAQDGYVDNWRQMLGQWIGTTIQN